MPSQDAKQVSGWQQPVLYRTLYIWFLVLSACDVVLTYAILGNGGYEVNPLAHGVLAHFESFGEIWRGVALVSYKFLLVTLVVCLCEIIGRKDRSTGRLVAALGVLLTLFPVTWSFIMLVYSR
jgi:hypothetical protein